MLRSETTRVRKRRGLAHLVAGGGLWGLGGLALVWGATFVPLAPGWESDCLLMSARQTIWGHVNETGEIERFVIPGVYKAAVVFEGRLYLFRGAQVWEAWAPGRLRKRQVFPQPVRGAAASHDSVALLLGGQWKEGRLHGATVGLWQPRNGALIRVADIWPRWNACWLRASPNGRFLLVGVWKAARFDPNVRLRPFLYKRQDATLQPVWRGTSFANPFVDAVFCDLSPVAPLEVAALELCVPGQRRVRVYEWSGCQMLAFMESEPAAFGNALQVAGAHILGVFRQIRQSWQFGLLEPQGPMIAEGLTRLVWRPGSPIWRERPLAWTMVRGQDGSWLVTAWARRKGIKWRADRILSSRADSG